MKVHKQSVSFTDTAFAYARTLVEAGEYQCCGVRRAGKSQSRAGP